ncbi:SIMPL domain-containing protein [Rhodococcus kronopolitis]|uniref:SIMPL domain-containing protein n=1 Tax=Rhodococcus kronopolitis TaxID=1460226 RepID=A0ABV9FMB0_9NOCA
MTPNATPSVTVEGQGSASATPDLMRVTVSVEARRPDVAGAFARAGEAAAAVAAALRGAGVADADLSTTGLGVQAETVWQENHGQQVVGYLATSTLAVTLRDLSDPGRVIADCVAAGGDDVRLGGLELGFADQDDLLGRAREAAYLDARTKAEQYARLSGRGLGAVLEVTETADARPSPRPMLRAMAATADASMPVERGESAVSAGVRVCWALI